MAIEQSDDTRRGYGDIGLGGPGLVRQRIKMKLAEGCSRERCYAPAVCLMGGPGNHKAFCKQHAAEERLDREIAHQRMIVSNMKKRGR